MDLVAKDWPPNNRFRSDRSRGEHPPTGRRMPQPVERTGREPSRINCGPAIWFLMLLTLPCAGGATCYRQTAHPQRIPPPEVFTGMPSLEELAEVVNRTDAIGQLSSNSVSVEVVNAGNVPRLSASLHVDRPRNFRLRASLPIMLGSGIDMGSNDEVFWFQVPEGMTQTLYHTTHEQFRKRPMRSILPVEPTWIGDALGLVHIDTDEVVEGPLLRTDGRLEVRTMVPMTDGLHSRVCIIEPTAGYVTDQMLYGPDGRMIAAASGELHRFYPDHQCALPHRVRIRLLPDEGDPVELRLDIGDYVVNQLISGDPQLFAMPRDAARVIDLSQLAGGNMVPPPQPRSAYATQPAAIPPMMPTYR